MSEKFVASNGALVEKDNHGCVVVASVEPLRESTQALREFFLHERDTELGRWRWPENPDYVVSLSEGGESIWVLNERESGMVSYTREMATPAGEDALGYGGAAVAYFAAHQEPSSLLGAVEGEVWLIEWYDGGAYQPVLILNGSERFLFRDGSSFKLNHRGVRSARRIFPEVVSDDS